MIRSLTDGGRTPRQSFRCWLRSALVGQFEARARPAQLADPPAGRKRKPGIAHVASAKADIRRHWIGDGDMLEGAVRSAAGDPSGVDRSDAYRAFRVHREAVRQVPFGQLDHHAVILRGLSLL